ncbi:alanine racemase [Telmatospirillum siberiense]|uniref:Alanine racemase n=1 Tax=Telmatospirillum siberiense TaxID=382514 RepID=A0A2N3PQ55_9PROT|nr:alanine racemase [Telmatospirillum siberiense]PKU22531.1 alanine racemase [Telmatospirillum siberiense]
MTESDGRLAGPSVDHGAARAGAILTIDLDAIVANWRFLNAKVAPASRCAAVVKADAYGLGAARVTPALYDAGCRRFVVATLDEALVLRPLLPEAEIFVLSGPFSGCEEEFPAAGVTPVLNSTEQIARWRAAANRLGRPLPSVLHVDTGMSRLGLCADEARLLAGDAETLAAIRPILLISHLACADEPAHPLNRKQLEAFRSARALFPGLPGSLAASSGIFLGSDWQADWCRPGAALYGVQPTATGDNPMRPVVRLDARIIQVRDVDAGESVGYGATHLARTPGRLAVVAAGYADGLFRTLGNRGCGYLGEHRVPLVGRVSMDLVIFDVTGLPNELATPGATISLIGLHNSVDDLGRAAGTIGYEILTSLGRRYHRHYLNGSPR